jgi:hypothetical protein
MRGRKPEITPDPGAITDAKAPKLEEMVGRGFTPAQAAEFLYDTAVTMSGTARPVTLH